MAFLTNSWLFSFQRQRWKKAGVKDSKVIGTGLL